MMNGAADWRTGAVIGISLMTLAACAPQPSSNRAATVMGGLAQDRWSANFAISHRFILRLPGAETEAVQQTHMAECSKLGCSILSTSIDRSNEGRVDAEMSIRIRPEAYDAFATVLAAPPARITMHAQSAEDLAPPILDAERRLEAKQVLRDRLTAMLHDSSVKTAADLITIEKELAQAQSEIEAMTAQRDQLRTRTDTVHVDIRYFGVAAQVGGIDLTPIHQAVRQIGQTVVSSISALITFLAAALVWLPLVTLIGWIIRRRMVRRASTA